MYEGKAEQPQEDKRQYWIQIERLKENIEDLDGHLEKLLCVIKPFINENVDDKKELDDTAINNENVAIYSDATSFIQDLRKKNCEYW